MNKQKNVKLQETFKELKSTVELISKRSKRRKCPTYTLSSNTFSLFPNPNSSAASLGSESSCALAFPDSRAGSRSSPNMGLLFSSASSCIDSSSPLSSSSIGALSSSTGAKQWSEFVISVNQFSIYGAVADMIKLLSFGQRAVAKPKAPSQLDKVEILQRQKRKPMKSDKETCCENTSSDLKIDRRPEVIQTMLRSRFEISRNWTILLFSSVIKRKRKSIFMPRLYDASRSRRNSYLRVDPKQCTILALSRT